MVGNGSHFWSVKKIDVHGRNDNMFNLILKLLVTFRVVGVEELGR
jgi:hypothetical protein